MSLLAFNEKAWDKIRPSSLKKTGVSEAIRAFEKAAPSQIKDLSTTEDCTAVDALLDALEGKLTGAKGQLDQKKNGDAVRTVTTWIGEVADKRKAITGQSDKLVKAVKDRLDDAQKVIEGYARTLTQMREAGQSMVSDIQDQAKAAVIAGAKGHTEELEEIERVAGRQTEAFRRLRSQARNVLPGITKEFYDALPGEDEVPRSLVGTRTKLETLYFKVKVDVDYFEELEEDFDKALQLIENAEKKGSDVEETFVKVVQADVATCQQMISEAGSSETAIDVDLKMVAERLQQAGTQGGNQGEQTQMLTQVIAVLKDAAGKIKRFQAQLTAAGKQLASKTKDYPDFVTADNPNFKLLLGDIDNMRDVVGDMSKKSLPNFIKKAQALGAEIVKLRKG